MEENHSVRTSVTIKVHAGAATKEERQENEIPQNVRWGHDIFSVFHAYCLKQLRLNDRSTRGCLQHYADMKCSSKSVAFQVECCATFGVSL